MQATIFSRLDESTRELLAILEVFTQEKFNQAPPTGGWSAAQVAEHIWLSEKSLPALLLGPSEPAERAPTEKVLTIESIFLDFNSKLSAPGFILPSATEQDKESLLQSLKEARAAIKATAMEIDLARSYPSKPFPGLGAFTGMEWLTFITCHALRHSHQLQQVQQAIGA